MRVILEQEDDGKEYAEIFITEKEIKKILNGCILVIEGKRRYSRKIIGIGVRKEDAAQERKESNCDKQ